MKIINTLAKDQEESLDFKEEKKNIKKLKKKKTLCSKSTSIKKFVHHIILI